MFAEQKPAVATVPIEASATWTYQRACFQGHDLRSKKCTFAWKQHNFNFFLGRDRQQIASEMAAFLWGEKKWQMNQTRHTTSMGDFYVEPLPVAIHVAA